MARSTRTPTTRYSDGHSIGALASEWRRPVAFVRRMISEGKLVVDDRGLITSAVLHDFFRLHGTELN